MMPTSGRPPVGGGRGEPGAPAVVPRSAEATLFEPWDFFAMRLVRHRSVPPERTA
jgi:hypothetical protein